MVRRNGALLGVVLSSVMSLTLAANAETKRYVVSFKNPNTFKAVAQQANSALLTAPGLASSTKLFNMNAAVTQALSHIQMLVVESEDPKAVESLRRHPAVALVEEEIFHPLPQPLATRSLNDVSSEVMRSSSPIDMPWGISAVKAPQAWGKSKGNAARVLVLDTGIDRDHEALRSRFEQGKDFVGAGDFNDNVGHGTHVAGTIAAAGENGGLVGVAPEAGILSGKVCSDRGCSSIAIMNGVDWAVEQKVDVVNMSLGGSFISEAEAQAYRRAEEGGVFIAAASGNSGNNRVSYPAALETVLAVGAVGPDLKKADFSQWGPELDVVAPGVDTLSSVPRGTGRGATVEMDFGSGMSKIPSMPFVGSPLRTGLENTLVFAGMGKTEDFSGVDVRGKFVLISRGEIPFKDKVKNAISAGAAGVIIYNNVPGLMQGAISEDGSEVAIPAAMIEQKHGESAKAALASGNHIRASISLIATDYAAFQGTSMATPHVAGVAALVRAANKNLTPAQVREVLRSTATPMSPNNENQYGSGLVNAEAAVERAKTMGAAQLVQLAN